MTDNEATQRQTVGIHTPFIKLDSFFKFTGALGTGGMAKEIIQGGLVRVNGSVCTQRGRKLVPGDVVAFETMEFEVGGA